MWHFPLKRHDLCLWKLVSGMWQFEGYCEMAGAGLSGIRREVVTPGVESLLWCWLLIFCKLQILGQAFFCFCFFCLWIVNNSRFIIDACFIKITIFDLIYSLLQLTLVSPLETLLWLSHLSHGFPWEPKAGSCTDVWIH